MKLILLIFLLVTIVPKTNFFAQDFDLKWSEKIVYENKKAGFFKDFVGSTESSIFVLNSNLALRKKKAEKQLNLSVYDKSSMRRIAFVRLKNSKDKGRTSELRNMTYHSLFYQNSLVYVFWTKSTNEGTSIFVETYDEKLQEVQSLKLVYQNAIKYKTTTLFSPLSSIFVLKGNENNKNILIGSEITDKDGEVSVQYSCINEELEVVSNGTVKLPIEKSKKYGGLVNSYRFGKDGNMYIISNVQMNKEERKKAAKGEFKSYSILSSVDVKNNEILSYALKFENKNIYDFDYVIGEKGIKIFGFFNDINLDITGTRTHGIFSSSINGKSLEMNEPNFSYFNKSFLDELFKGDEQDKKRTSALFKKKRKKNEALDEVALDARFVIEKAIIDEKDNLLLFCSKMYNYSVTTCTSTQNGGQTCTTKYYCDKSNVTTFKLGRDGEIIWANNVDRFKTYSGTSIYDLRVASDKENHYVIYGSSVDIEKNSRNKKTAKSKKEMRDLFEYAVISDLDGNSTKKEFVVNPPKTKKAERKTVNPLKISVIDNKFYVNSMKLGYKPAITAGLCAASIVCAPVIYVVLFNGDVRRGKGNLGVLDIIK